MRFTDRKEEMGRLERLTRGKSAGLVALWGRRRVGKTRLLSEWCSRNDGVYTVADQSSDRVQRQYFADSVGVRFPGFADVEYKDWYSLLRRVSADSKASGWNGPLVIDEFPHLVQASPSLPSVMQNWLDHEVAASSLLVAVAGSSQRMMQGMVLDASAPLYGRAIEAFALEPIAAGYIGEALGLSSPRDAVRAYSVWGGIPRYWELAAAYGDDLDSAVDAVVLDPLGILHVEPDRLLVEESPSALSLRPLLDVIGNGCHRLSEIAARLGCPATSLHRQLLRLQDLGLVTRETPFGESEKGGKCSLYRVSDPFFAFWFRVVAPHRGLLASSDRDARLRLYRQFHPVLLSRTWESLCRKGMARMLERRMPGGWIPASRWWRGRLPEWDAVSVAQDGTAAVAEVKWSDSTFSTDRIQTLAHELRSRPLPPLAAKEVVRILFVPDRDDGGGASVDGVQVVTARQVMEALL